MKFLHYYSLIVTVVAAVFAVLYFDATNKFEPELPPITVNPEDVIVDTSIASTPDEIIVTTLPEETDLQPEKPKIRFETHKIDTAGILATVDTSEIIRKFQSGELREEILDITDSLYFTSKDTIRDKEHGEYEISVAAYGLFPVDKFQYDVNINFDKNYLRVREPQVQRNIDILKQQCQMELDKEKKKKWKHMLLGTVATVAMYEFGGETGRKLAIGTAAAGLYFTLK